LGGVLFNNENTEARWMTKLSNDTRINQINIPGTHDSGTYAVDVAGLPIIDLFRGWWGRTQTWIFMNNYYMELDI